MRVTTLAGRDTFSTAWAYGLETTDGLVLQSVLADSRSLSTATVAMACCWFGKPHPALQQLASSLDRHSTATPFGVLP
jgi:hypothetical protein